MFLITCVTDFKKLCESCSEQGCCTNSATPLIFPSDLEKLKRIGKATDQFLKKKDVGKYSIDIIKKKENSNMCIFWDEDAKNCSIYSERPFDCKAYPFDILKVEGEYHWIVYSCNPSSDWEWSESYLKMLEEEPGFDEIIKNIEIFEQHTKMILPTESQKTPFVILRKVTQQN